MRVARVYLRTSTDSQDLSRQERVVDDAKAAGFYIACVYRETASGARPDRPELDRLIRDLQPGEVVVAERMDRISRLPLPDAERLISRIREKGARLAVPDVLDLSEISAHSDGLARVVFDAVQELLLKLALQMAYDDHQQRRERQRQGIERAKAQGKYKGRRTDKRRNARILELRAAGHSIAATARLSGSSPSTVKRVCQEATRRSSGPSSPATGPAPAGQPG
jgi:DNA invertase Pin-like site-specific DNA recombinase